MSIISNLPKSFEINKRQFFKDSHPDGAIFTTRGFEEVDENGYRNPDKRTQKSAATLVKILSLKGLETEIELSEKGWLTVYVSTK